MDNVTQTVTIRLLVPPMMHLGGCGGGQKGEEAEEAGQAPHQGGEEACQAAGES